MLKNKTKEQLLELLYQANNENYNLQICNDTQAGILKNIAKLYHQKGFFARLYNFFALPYRILQLLKKSNEYFYTINEFEKMNLTREQVIAANRAILDFENKRIAPNDYQKMVIEMLKLPKNCPTCGDVAGRLHNDFQKRVIAEMQAKYPDLLPTPPTFKSGQFQGDTYKKWAQTYHFKGLAELLSRMKTAALNAKQRGVLEQSKLMLEDCEALKDFIAFRKFGLVENEETTGVVALDSEKEAVEIEINLTDKEVLDFANEGEKGVLSEVENTNEAAKEKKLYKDEDALALQNKGMKLEDIAAYYGVSAATISRKLAKYKEILAVEKPTE